MKKFKKILYILFVIVVLIVCCYLVFNATNKKKVKNDDVLIKHGYNKDEVLILRDNLSEDNISKLLLFDYNEHVDNFILIDGFKFDSLNKYIIYLSTNKDAPYTDVVLLVNSDVDVNYSTDLMKILNDKHFISDNIERYLAYFKLSNTDIVKKVNSNLDYEFYTNIKKANTDDDLLILVNKYYNLDENYVPSDLKSLDGYRSDFKLRSVAADSYMKMESEAKQLGYNLIATSPYRSYDLQDYLYENYAKNDGYSEADRYSARPGHSEHQTGLAIDIVSGSGGGLDGFGKAKEFTWMNDNAHKYGFILRYTEATEYITGYMNEPWHYRYIGLKHATKVKELGITYEEYYAYYINKNR